MGCVTSKDGAASVKTMDLMLHSRLLMNWAISKSSKYMTFILIMMALRNNLLGSSIGVTAGTFDCRHMHML